VDNNEFSDGGLALDTDGGLRIIGKVVFSDVIKYPKTFRGRNIMGPFMFAPGMQCSHAVVHVESALSGVVNIDGTDMLFDGGKGYAEKDFGKSFPSKWLWLHADNFPDDVSVMLSLADVPIMKRSFEGVISMIKVRNKLYNISTYNGARIILDRRPGQIVIANRRFKLDVIISNGGGVKLLAPGPRAKMEREITETLTANVGVRLHHTKGGIIYSGVSSLAGLEIGGE
jgi:hypothetical protein